MSCHNCAITFGWLKKELECSNCRKSVCKDCLNCKIFIPKLSPKDVAVCSPCFNKLKRSNDAAVSSNKRNQPTTSADPSTYMGPSMRTYATGTQNKPCGTDTTQEEDPDVKLRERLNQLKEKKDATPVTTNDIENKFLQVTGHKASSTAESNINKPQPKLTEAEEISILLEKTNEEVAIDKKYEDSTETNQSTADKLLEMEDRLYKLKGIDPEKVKEKRLEDYDSSEDENEAAEKILKKVIAESKLEDKLKNDGHGDIISARKEDIEFPRIPSNNPGQAGGFTFNPEEEEEELPWCCICNADAALRCHGCDDDLYCNRCFREGHDKFDLEDHTTSNYRPKSKR